MLAAAAAAAQRLIQPQAALAARAEAARVTALYLRAPALQTAAAAAAEITQTGILGATAVLAWSFFQPHKQQLQQLAHQLLPQTLDVLYIRLRAVARSHSEVSYGALCKS